MPLDPSEHQLEAAAEILRALADPHRLRILLRLAKGELNVGQLAELEQEKMQTMSARLKVLPRPDWSAGGERDRRPSTPSPTRMF